MNKILWLPLSFTLGCLTGACGASEREMLHHRGISLSLGPYEHPEAIPYIDSALEFLGYDIVQAQVILSDDIEPTCGPNTAGCSMVDLGGAVVLDKESLWETALAHELVHLTKAPYDYNHELPIWQDLNQAGLNGNRKDYSSP